MNIRMLPPVAVPASSIVVYGRSYVAAPGAFLDVVSGDAAVLGANGWTAVGPVGPTASRPTLNAAGGPYLVAARGMIFVDTTLAKVIQFDGAVWRDPTTGGAV